jgi:hypothetical protein
MGNIQRRLSSCQWALPISTRKRPHLKACYVLTLSLLLYCVPYCLPLLYYQPAYIGLCAHPSSQLGQYLGQVKSLLKVLPTHVSQLTAYFFYRIGNVHLCIDF